MTSTRHSKKIKLTKNKGKKGKTYFSRSSNSTGLLSICLYVS